MRIIGISTSPRKNGNTTFMIKHALEMIKSCETEYISLSELEIKPCSSCDACKEKPECIIKDGMENIYPILKQADGIIIGSPVYFGNMSAQCKALIDRTLVLRRHEMALKDKVLGVLAVGRSRNGGQELTVMSIHNAFLIHECIIVSDQTTAHFGGLVVEPANKDELGLKTVENLAKKVEELVIKLNR
ncbi:MAG: flavodoxin family protein [Candidatus Lokiarchaeota archaeon]|nr:flavodoxin family protein [Candidatus Lokiarchaeota archaeon]